ncbi:MAG: hypothetical protein ACRERU_05560 [Methylococcales bacterium]
MARAPVQFGERQISAFVFAILQKDIGCLPGLFRGSCMEQFHESLEWFVITNHQSAR